MNLRFFYYRWLAIVNPALIRGLNPQPLPPRQLIAVR
jgi:hypothetical protein